MLLALDGPEPLHQQVYSGLRCAILRGDLRPGTRLPSSRGLAEELSVSRTTVVLAFDQLRAEGYVCGRHGSGTYVVEELPDLRPDPVPEPESPAPASGPGAADVSLSAYAARLVRAVPVSVASPARIRYDFRYGKLAVEEFPHDVWRRLHNNRSRMVSPRSVSYGDPEGHTRLREAVADYLVRARGVRCRAEQILIVNGSQQALDLAARVLIDPGDAVLMEEPTYHGARVCFEAVGATIVSGPVDIHGLQTADLARRAGPARVAYVTPSHQFPTGATMCLYRRLELLDWAASAGAVVFEDDYDSEFRYEGRPIQSLQGLDEQGSVIYAGTFSKVMFPALRIGYVVLPPALVPAFRAAKWAADRHTPTLNQETLADFISEGHFERHLRRARKRHSARRVALLGALAEHFGDAVEIQGESAGIHLVAWLRDTSEAQLAELLRRALGAGVFATSVARYYSARPPGAGLLLGYTNVSEARIDEGVELLADLWRDVRSPA